MAGTDLSEFEGAGERFKFLIQPVKDLAANWDLNIAKTLEDYIRKVIEESDQVNSETQTDEQQHKRRKVFNFAEAALLIHGTTTVYARKVEYVLQQAQNFFDNLQENEQRGKRDRAAHAEQEADEADADENVDPQDASGEERERRQPKLTINHAALAQLLGRLSVRRSPLLPIVPIAFFPLTDFEKRDVSLCTRTNPTEVIGKKEDFKLNSCHIHGSIALLDSKNISIISKFSQLALNSQQREPSYHQENGGPDTQNLPFEGPAIDVDDNVNGQEIERRGTQERPGTQNLPLEVLADGDMGDTGEYSTKAFSAHEDEQGVECNNCTEPIRIGLSLREQTIPVDAELALKIKLLDPNEVVNAQSRPFRRKENCVMSAIKQIRARNRRIERDCVEKGVPNVATIKHYIETRIFRHQIKNRAHTLGLFNTFIADKAVLALNPLIHEEEKRRADLKKKRRKEIQNAQRAERAVRRAVEQQQEVDPVLAENDVGTENSKMQEGEEEEEADEFDDPMDELVAEEMINLPQDENWGDELEQDEHQNLGDILEVEDLENSFGRVQNLYAGFEHLNTVQRKRAKTLATRHNLYDDTIFATGDINPDDLPPRPISQMDYDEIIAFHLRKYWTASEQATSTFSEHIQQWETRMTDLLEQEQLHREFCTSTYGDELLDRFGGQIHSEIDFTKMLHELPNDYDQSRFLLVALILANLGNVHIINNGETGEHVRLQLLSLKSREFSL